MDKNQFLRVLRSNVAKLETALTAERNSRTYGYVFVWPEYHLAVKVNNDVCHAVAVDLATVVSGRDNRVFFNGRKDRAVLTLREDALSHALAHARDMLENFEDRLTAA
jgi:hypothetical protein